jgi:2-phospho-L-lactate transferase CofD
VSPPSGSAGSAVEAIRRADWVLLAPGSLYTSTLATAALPQIALAIAQSPARVLWLCNLDPGCGETAGMTAEDHLSALRRHGIRVDSVLYDPAAKLRVDPATLARNGLPGFAHPLQSGRLPVHDTSLLGAALDLLVSAQPSAARALAGTG